MHVFSFLVVKLGGRHCPWTLLGATPQTPVIATDNFWIRLRTYPSSLVVVTIMQLVHLDFGELLYSEDRMNDMHKRIGFNIGHNCRNTNITCPFLVVCCTATAV